MLDYHHQQLNVLKVFTVMIVHQFLTNSNVLLDTTALREQVYHMLVHVELSQVLMVMLEKLIVVTVLLENTVLELVLINLLMTVPLPIIVQADKIPLHLLD